MDIGLRLRQLRKSQSLTTAELASIVNTTQQTISNYENNKSEPNLAMIESICTALGISLADFFAEDKQELEPEMRRLVETARKLTPEQREHLQKLLETMGKG